MQTTMFKKWLPIFLCVALIAALALCFTGCDGGKETPSGDEKAFTFAVVDPEGKETTFQITSSKKTVGEALLDEKLIAGEDGPYGLYVKTVNGITLDYDTDGMYWSFYAGEDYSLTGVDQTDITAGAVYSFRAESAE